MKKEVEYIRDENVIRNCSTNKAKMSIPLLIYHDVFIWRDFPRQVLQFFMDLGQTLFELFLALVNILLLIFFPILLIIRAYKDRRIARKMCAQFGPQKK